MQKAQGRPGRATQLIDRIPSMLREHGVIVVILLMGFVMRLFLADTNSYWHDEILSVVTFGIGNRTGADALETISHEMQPPLHQIILYYWMVLFGDSEVATRTLSNLCVAGATLCLYILTLGLYAPRVAIATALIFSLMYIPIYYALEARCYAQVLLLASLSSLMLYYLVRHLPERLVWGSLLRDGRLYALVLVNSALLLTHYYSVFFLGAQGIFLLAYLLVRARGRDLISTAAKTAAITAAPLLLLLVTWGPVMAGNYERLKSRREFMVAGLPPDPFSIFFDMVARPNFVYPALATAVMAMLLSLRLARSGTVIRRGETYLSPYFDFYFVIAALMPCVLTFLTFLISGHQRFSPRYFSFCTPPLAVLLALSAQEAVRLIDDLMSRASIRADQWYRAPALLIAMLAALLVVLPRGYRAATVPKTDWRGTARAIASLARSQPDKGFIVYEVGYRPYPMFDYYLARFSPTLRVQGVIRRAQERSRKPFDVEAQAEKIGKYDYLVLVFPNLTTKSFPKVLASLAKHYKVRFSLLNDGRGFIVYRVRG
jgi:4-amino-4-deoxy-L-arabinose transferase-like glycosyltransferase